MGAGHWSPEQIVRKLCRAGGLLASGASVSEVARELGVNETIFRWGNHYAYMNPSEMTRLKELEKENAHLKKSLAKASLATQTVATTSRLLYSPCKEEAFGVASVALERNNKSFRRSLPVPHSL
jgi:putative transposase